MRIPHSIRLVLPGRACFSVASVALCLLYGLALFHELEPHAHTEAAPDQGCAFCHLLTSAVDSPPNTVVAFVPTICVVIAPLGHEQARVLPALSAWHLRAPPSLHTA